MLIAEVVDILKEMHFSFYHLLSKTGKSFRIITCCLCPSSVLQQCNNFM